MAILRLDHPAVLGHEAAGEIVGLGEEIEGPKAGDRVTPKITSYI